MKMVDGFYTDDEVLWMPVFVDFSKNEEQMGSEFTVEKSSE